MTVIDPFTYEVLRHRLWTINQEGALALQRVSGSPLATEAFDMNTSIMSAAGEVVVVGPYLLTGPMGQGMIVRWILAHYVDDPGIEPGDVFICNDPYVGSAHQNCVTVVAPIHASGALVAWAGATLHVVDVGGPTAGQVGIGARSIFDEAPVMPPLKIARAGRILPDVEANYLRRSRTPELNALDLRAKLAALSTIAGRVGALIGEHGAETFTGVLATSIDRATDHLRARIAELPDGVVHQTAYVDRADADGVTFHGVVLRLEKHGDRLLLDFGGSAAQVPAVINCTRSGLLSGVLVGVLTTLVWDWPWCPAAIERSIEVVSAPGTIVDATWPAGCSMATMAAGFAATTTTALAVGELLARTPALQDRAMAAWAGAVGSVDVFGADAAGRRFGTVLLDTMASGTGASAASDGIDTGGFIRSMAAVVANVEHTEAQFPILYLYRRQEPDTGGPGRRRGGVGVRYAIVPHGVDRIDTVSPHFSGAIEPESLGLVGGYPGATNAAGLMVGTTVRAAMAAGRLPSEPAELGRQLVPLPAVAAVTLGADDVLVVQATGGGGFGDPIERDPAAVAADLEAGLVGRVAARDLYGVAIESGGRIDVDGTAALRRAMRRTRIGREATATDDDPVPDRHAAPERAPAPERDPATGLASTDADPAVRESDTSAGRPETDHRAAHDGVVLRTGPDGPTVFCLRCGDVTPAPAGDDPTAAFPSAIRDLNAAGPHVGGLAESAPFHLRERYCRRCGRLVAVERIQSHGGADDG